MPRLTNGPYQTGPRTTHRTVMDGTTVRVDFNAYAVDCMVRGTVLLANDRLTDLLSEDGHLDVEDATIQAHDDGRVLDLPRATLIRGDLCAVSATGPRGDKQRRLRTRQRPMRVRLGPYTIVGYLHASPATDAVSAALRRRIIPLTSTTIEYEMLGRRVEEHHGALLLVRERIDWLQAASDDEVGLARAMDLRHVVDSSAKDLTGLLKGNGW